MTELKALTVGQLRRMIANASDDTPVEVTFYPSPDATSFTRNVDVVNGGVFRTQRNAEGKYDKTAPASDVLSLFIVHAE
jgi:hypothetical protein